MRVKNKLKPIGILGGTFDPIHFGHCHTALELFQCLDLAEVRFIPCKSPVHKHTTIASAEHRKAMVELAIHKEAHLTLDTRELDRQTPSYMIETLESLRAEFGAQPLCLILGMDAVAKLDSWHRWTELLDYAHIIAIYRPDFHYHWKGKAALHLKPHLTDDPKLLHNNPAGSVLLQKTTLLNVSATEIRHLIKTGKSPRYLLPESVLMYIYHQKLYV